MSDEQPVLFTDSCGSDRILHCVVFDGDLAVIEVAAQAGSVVQGIGAGFAELAFGQCPLTQNFR